MTEDKQQSAFPHPKEGGAWGSDPVPGMTLRDYFAAHAPDPRFFDRKTKVEQWVEEHEKNSSGNTATVKTRYVDEEYAKYIARWSYHYADAMMEARGKK